MDPYDPIVDFYDLEHAELEEDVEFFLNHVTLGPVLEVGAGTGRVTEALARAGHEVWAVDSSPAMLQRAHQRLAAFPNVHLVESDITSLEIEARCRVAILSLNFLWHLAGTEEQLAALAVVRRHLVPRGLLVVDGTNAITMTDRGARGEIRERFRGESSRGHILGTSASWDDPAEQTLAVHLTYQSIAPDGATETYLSQMSLRYLYRFELELLLRHANFDVEQLYGSYDLDPYLAESPNLIAVARRAADD